ncbi:amidohydrolase [Thermosipho affectus]|uniref:Amidohydrolase n=1 Tax=Thermosipho affectus TaxID=660294 RepID=A0ABX3IGQ3_9BACT|nr:amidohydrolase [Thermosipho affectus]ONN26479.1 amidohydrolase [Thermosipho affectus]
MILKNAYVLKSWEKNPEKLDIKVENGIIVEIKHNLQQEDDEIIELKNKLIIPGLVNTHTHAAMSIFRGIAEDVSFNDWLFKTIIPLEEKLDYKTVYYSTLISLMEMAQNGIVAFCDMYIFEDAVAQAVADFGIKALLTRGLVSENDKIEKTRLNESLKLYNKWHGYDNRIFIGLGPHAPYTCSIPALKEISKISEELDIPITIHLFENKWEREKYSLKEILDTGIANNHLLAVHCIHLDDNDIQLLKNYNVYISHNPSSNLKLGNGIAPVTKFINNDLPVTLGTDGPASNNSIDILFEARLATLLQKKDNPKNLSVDKAIKMITYDGYKALNLNGGTIGIGKPADFTIINLNNPSFFPVDNMKKHIIHSKTSIFATMVNGKFIYFNGKFPTIDEKEVYKQFSNSYKKVIGTEN